MHYTINYSNIADKAIRNQKALQDVKSWCGWPETPRLWLALVVAMYEMVRAYWDNKNLTSRKIFVKEATIMLSFAGVQGYPARCIMRAIIKGELK